MKTIQLGRTQIFHQWNVPVLAIVVAVVMAMCSLNLQAQSGAGSIEGTVADSTGAVIPGAQVHVVNQATSVAANTKSNNVGFYLVPELFTGTYAVTITAPDMKTYKTSIDLLVDQHAVINPTMTPGLVTQQIVVSADEAQLTTKDSGTISNTLENQRLNQLPMNGRTLAVLVKQATPGLESSATGGSGSRANGLMGEALEYVADGVALSDRQFGGMNQASAQTPDPDAIQEVRMETSDTSAQYATPGTALITTKSGSNTIHGSLFETARNNAVGVARARSNPSNFAAPHYVRNEYGASAGGPIVIPRLYDGRDKSFWFLAFEQYSLASFTWETANVPTTAMRTGDFSGLVTSSGVLQQLYDPATTTNSANCNGTGVANPYCRAPFVNNQIPINRLDADAKIMYDITPQPTSAANPLLANNLTTPNVNNQQIPTYTFRLDHTFNENSRAYLRFTDNISTQFALRNNPANGPATLAADGMPYGASGLSYNPTSTFAGAIGFTHVFSPTFYSETVVSQQWFGQHNFAAGSPTINFEQKLGLPNNFGESGLPYIGSTLICPWQGQQYVYGLSQIISTADENLTKTIGKHQLQFGGRYRHERFGDLPDQLFDSQGFGAYASAIYNTSTGSSFTASPNTGYAEGDFFLGAAYQYTVNEQPPYDHFHDMEFDAYFQDNYHVTRNLTVNLGLRYEAHPAPWAKDGLMQSFDLKNDAMVLANPVNFYIANGYTTQTIITNLQNLGAVIETPQQAGMPSALMNNYDLTVGPRVGIAYLPFSGKYGTVVRGGYGRYIYPAPVRSILNSVPRNSPFTGTYSMNYLNGAQSPDGLGNYLLRYPQPVVMGVNSANVVSSGTVTSISPGVSLFNNNPDMPPDYATETNLTVEQPLKGNSVLRLSWVWSHATNMDQEYEYNLHPSNYDWEMESGLTTPSGSLSAVATGPYDQKVWGSAAVMNEKSGWSNDNLLQGVYQRLFHHGIAYQVDYAWSRAFRVGGNSFRDSLIVPTTAFAGNTGEVGTMTPYGTVVAPALPPARPAGLAPYAMWHGLDRFENYVVDTALPKQHITFNGIVDLPVGRGKRFLGKSNRFLDELVGGFQLAGDGNIASNDFQPYAQNWGPTNPLKVYKHKSPIMDCRSGVCIKGYDWYNGYIAPTFLPTAAAYGNVGCTQSTKGVVTGLAPDWAPYQTPMDTDCVSGTPNYSYYGSNEAKVTLSNGTYQNQTYAPAPNGALSGSNEGSNPYAHTVLNGPINWTADLSVFKVFPITERLNLRVNVDAFNVLNMQGYNLPNITDGTELVQPGGVGASSFNTPRQLQFTMRLSF